MRVGSIDTSNLCALGLGLAWSSRSRSDSGARNCVDALRMNFQTNLALLTKFLENVFDAYQPAHYYLHPRCIMHIWRVYSVVCVYWRRHAECTDRLLDNGGMAAVALVQVVLSNNAQRLCGEHVS